MAKVANYDYKVHCYLSDNHEHIRKSPNSINEMQNNGNIVFFNEPANPPSRLNTAVIAVSRATIQWTSESKNESKKQ